MTLTHSPVVSQGPTPHSHSWLPFREGELKYRVKTIENMRTDNGLPMIYNFYSRSRCNVHNLGYNANILKSNGSDKIIMGRILRHLKAYTPDPNPSDPNLLNLNL